METPWATVPTGDHVRIVVVGQNSAQEEIHKMTMADKTLTCRDCSNDFVFTAGEQEFYASKGFTREPTRCPKCRAARKRDREGGYVGGTYTSGGPTSGQGPAGNFERRERRMYSVTCADCGKEAEVPFQPRGDRPVYCSDCFRNHSANRF